MKSLIVGGSSGSITAVEARPKIDIPSADRHGQYSSLRGHHVFLSCCDHSLCNGLPPTRWTGTISVIRLVRPSTMMALSRAEESFRSRSRRPSKRTDEVISGYHRQYVTAAEQLDCERTNRDPVPGPRLPKITLIEITDIEAEIATACRAQYHNGLQRMYRSVSSSSHCQAFLAMLDCPDNLGKVF